MSKIPEYLRMIIETGEGRTMAARVVSVDESERTCKVIPLLENAEYISRLQAVNSSTTGLFIIPAVGSYVGIIVINTKLSFVFQYSEIEKILLTIGNTSLSIKDGEVVFNDGLKGGLVVSQSVANKLNALEQRMLSHQHLYVTPAGPPAPTTPDPATNPAISPTNASDLENTNIKHG